MATYNEYSASADGRNIISNHVAQRPRVVLLVTGPVGKSYQTIASAVGRAPPPSRPVDWYHTENRALPSFKRHQKFTTHIALCAIDEDDWEDSDMPLYEKFDGATFWDHPGGDSIVPYHYDESMGLLGKNDGVRWSRDKFLTIDSGVKIGRTDKSNWDITKIYYELMRDWNYTPLFWNCHDLAICLAHLIVRESQAVTNSLRTIMEYLRKAYEREFWKAGGKKFERGVGVMGGGAVLAATPLAPIGWAMVAGGAFNAFLATGGIEKGREGRRQRPESERIVKGRFPKLRELLD